MTTTATKTTGSALHSVIRHYFGTGDRVFAIMDAARDKELVLAARNQFQRRINWLFKEDASAHMSEVAPYLVSVPFRSNYPYEGSELLDLWAEHLGGNAGILLLTGMDEPALLDHLRGLFRVTDEEDHNYFFRFYDPRVLRAYLPTCTGMEAGQFFGPIHRMVFEAETASTLLCCRAGRDGVGIDERPLQQANMPSRRVEHRR